jgi:aminoglycoside phosphotransferase (APT) family kinase protein
VADNSIETGLARFVAARLPDVSNVLVDEVDRIHGGASRQTYRLRLQYDQDGRAIERRLILRRDPESSLIETERSVEFAAYRAMLGTAIPVPEALWLEEGDDWLGAPFFVMEELQGYASDLTELVSPPYAELADKLAESKWSILGELARMDPTDVGLHQAFEVPEREECWRRELDKWEAILDEEERTPQPVTRAAIRWLRRNPPPPPARVGIVHGDYRSGNFLFNTEGVQAILDWEMAHLGDPLEDLGWSLSPLWHIAKDDRAGGLVVPEQAIAIWEKAAGRPADRDALYWWQLFGCVKGQAIWVTAAKQYVEGPNKDVVLALSAWSIALSQDVGTLAVMEKRR